MIEISIKIHPPQMFSHLAPKHGKSRKYHLTDHCIIPASIAAPSNGHKFDFIPPPFGRLISEILNKSNLFSMRVFNSSQNKGLMASVTLPKS